MSLGSDFLASSRSRRPPNLISEINVTPFVDVMLVLLVIFMVTAPILVTGVDVDLPDSRSKQLASDVEPIQVAIDSNQEIYLGETLLSRDDFNAAIVQLAASVDDLSNQRVYVRADKTLPYGLVMAIVSELSGVGFSKVAFVSDNSDGVNVNGSQ